jgi:hypothetical protein
MTKKIIFEKDRVICETEKLDKSGKTVTQSKTMITAGIAKSNRTGHVEQGRLCLSQTGN